MSKFKAGDRVWFHRHHSFGVIKHITPSGSGSVDLDKGWAEPFVPSDRLSLVEEKPKMKKLDLRRPVEFIPGSVYAGRGFKILVALWEQPKSKEKIILVCENPCGIRIVKELYSDGSFADVNSKPFVRNVPRKEKVTVHFYKGAYGEVRASSRADTIVHPVFKTIEVEVELPDE